MQPPTLKCVHFPIRQEKWQEGPKQASLQIRNLNPFIHGSKSSCKTQQRISVVLSEEAAYGIMASKFVMLTDIERQQKSSISFKKIEERFNCQMS